METPIKDPREDLLPADPVLRDGQKEPPRSGGGRRVAPESRQREKKPSRSVPAAGRRLVQQPEGEQGEKPNKESRAGGKKQPSAPPEEGACAPAARKSEAGARSRPTGGRLLSRLLPQLRKLPGRTLLWGAVLTAGLAVCIAVTALRLNSMWAVVVNGEILGVARDEATLTRTVDRAVAARQGDLPEGEVLEDIQVRPLQGPVPRTAATAADEITASLYSAITVRSVVVTRQEEAIPFGSITDPDDTMYTDQSTVTQEGSDGVREITVTTVYENGTEVSSLRETRVLTPAVPRRTSVGTRTRPEFIRPCSGVVTSGFSLSRTINGVTRPHKGTDFDADVGDPIVASRAGTVEFSGWNSGGFGNLVILDHGGGIRTYYAHNSRLLVLEGEQVEQGQTIALAGNTGRSFGCHCHFEIRIDGVAVNPMRYIDG